MQVLVFCDFGLKMPIQVPFWWVFGAHFPQKMSLIVLTLKRTVLRRNHVIWATKHEYRPRGSSWACEEEKKNSTGQDRKKVTKGLYFTYLTEAIYIKNCVVGDLLDVITCVKFQNEIFMGYDFAGVEFSIFLLISEWALQECSATALPVTAPSTWNTILCSHRQRSSAALL